MTPDTRLATSGKARIASGTRTLPASTVTSPAKASSIGEREGGMAWEAGSPTLTHVPRAGTSTTSATRRLAAAIDVSSEARRNHIEAWERVASSPWAATTCSTTRRASVAEVFASATATTSLVQAAMPKGRAAITGSSEGTERGRIRAQIYGMGPRGASPRSAPATCVRGYGSPRSAWDRVRAERLVCGEGRHESALNHGTGIWRRGGDRRRACSGLPC